MKLHRPRIPMALTTRPPGGRPSSVGRVRRLAGSLLLLLLASGALAQSWRLNYQDADLEQFVTQVADITGRTMILDPRVRGEVTVISDEELSADQVYKIFLTVLRMQGFTVSEEGNETHILPVNDAKQVTGPLIQGEVPADGRAFVTRVIALEHLSALEMIPILRPLGASYGHMSGIASVNAILMVDHARNIARVEQVLARLDLSTEQETRLVRLEHARVAPLMELLRTLLPDELADNAGDNAMAGNLRIVADERSNRLILRGGPETLVRVERLVQELDVPTPERDGSIEVLFLDNADAVKLAETLRGLVGETQPANAEGAAVTQVEQAILADEELNALILRGAPDDLDELRNVVHQLDIPRAQVLIEAAIVEVSGSLSDQFGIQTGLLNASTDTVPALVGTNVQESTINSLPGAANGSGVGPATQAGQGGFFGALGLSQGDLTFGAIIQALETRSNTNLLSTPYVMTMDNSEARLVVGETVPFRRADPTEDNPFTITREDVATEITVTPNIQQNEMIRLAINQKTEELLGGPSLESRTSKREIDTNVLVASGETIVLGGLVKDRVIENEFKVPLLGDIPWLGRAFRRTTTEQEKVNLLVVIRPSIARERTTEQARERYLGIWELRMENQDGEGSGPELIIEPPSFDQLYRGLQSRPVEPD